MPWNVFTNGKLEPFGNDLMKMFDADTGDEIGRATRTQQGQWLIHVDEMDDITADNRSDAIDSLMTQLDTKNGNDAFTAVFPTGLRGVP